MDIYPLNLILAVATASATIFLGFLPTKTVTPTFFAREAGKAIFAWLIVAVTSPYAIVHYPGLLAFLCFASWWNFRRDRALAGKMWLSIASGLGISIGVMLILATTPRANPPGLPQLNETLLLASIYLGGSVIGLSYVCFALIQGTKANSGVTQATIQRYVGLLVGLTLARAATLVVSCWYSNLGVMTRAPAYHAFHYDPFISANFFQIEFFMLAVACIAMPICAVYVQRGAAFSSRAQPIRPLIAIIFLSFLTEILARILVL